MERQILVEESNNQRQPMPFHYQASNSSGIYGCYTPNIFMNKIVNHSKQINLLHEKYNETQIQMHAITKETSLMQEMLHNTIKSVQVGINKTRYKYEQKSEEKADTNKMNEVIQSLQHKVKQCMYLQKRLSNSLETISHLYETFEEQQSICKRLIELDMMLIKHNLMHNDEFARQQNEVQQRFYHNDEMMQELIHRLPLEWKKLLTALTLENRLLHEELIKQLSSTGDIFKLAKQIYKERGSPVFIDRKNTLNDIMQNSNNYKNVALPIQLGQDKPFNQWNEQSFTNEFSNKFNIPIECIEIICVKSGSCIIDLKLKTHSNGNKLMLPIESIAENISTDAAKKELVEFGIFAMEFGQVEAGQPCLKQRIIMNPRWNKVYGPGHVYWNGAINDGKSRGGEPYYCPSGWKRFAVQFSETAYDFDNVYDNWPIAYHGTKFTYSMMITLSGLKASDAFKGRHESHPCGVYLSPSIKYVSHPRYAEPYHLRNLSSNVKQREWTSQHTQLLENYNNKWIQCAFACRVKPGSYLKRCQTMRLGNNGRFDNIDKREIEWIVPADEGTIIGSDKILIYGIMIKASDTKPHGYEPEPNGGCSIM